MIDLVDFLDAATHKAYIDAHEDEIRALLEARFKSHWGFDVAYQMQRYVNKYIDKKLEREGHK